MKNEVSVSLRDVGRAALRMRALVKPYDGAWVSCKIDGSRFTRDEREAIAIIMADALGRVESLLVTQKAAHTNSNGADVRNVRTIYEFCRKGHARTEENTRIADGARICRICERERTKKSYQKKSHK